MTEWRTAVWEWLESRFRKKKETDSDGSQKTLLADRVAQQLRLELTEREETIRSLQADLERHRHDEKARIEEVVRARIGQLLADLATPTTILLTQEYLLENEGTSVQSRDILAVSRSLVRVLQDFGLTTVGNVGETVPYDEGRHELLGPEFNIVRGEAVVVRFVGLSWQGKTLRKPKVEKKVT